MVIIIALSIRTRSYRYWMRLSRRSYGCATKTSYDTILRSQDLWARILILKHKWRALSGREDCPCEDFRRATEEDLAVRERVPSRTEIPSVREPGTNGNMNPLVNHRTAVIVIIAEKSQSQWTMYVQTGMKTNMLHLQVEKIWEGMSM